MERNLLQKGMDYLKKVGKQLVSSGADNKEVAVVEDKPTDRPLSAQSQSEIQNLERELK